jgi:hypothetical protein
MDLTTDLTDALCLGWSEASGTGISGAVVM